MNMVVRSMTRFGEIFILLGLVAVLEALISQSQIDDGKVFFNKSLMDNFPGFKEILATPYIFVGKDNNILYANMLYDGKYEVSNVRDFVGCVALKENFKRDSQEKITSLDVHCNSLFSESKEVLSCQQKLGYCLKPVQCMSTGRSGKIDSECKDLECCMIFNSQTEFTAAQKNWTLEMKRRRDVSEVSGKSLTSSVRSPALGSSTIESSTIKSTTLKSTTIKSTTIESSMIQSTPLKSSTIESTPLKSSTIKSSTIESTTLKSTTIKTTTLKSSTIKSTTLKSSTIGNTMLASSTIESSTLKASTSESLAFEGLQVRSGEQTIIEPLNNTDLAVGCVAVILILGTILIKVLKKA